jgi:hypothetical protein
MGLSDSTDEIVILQAPLTSPEFAFTSHYNSGSYLNINTFRGIPATC